MSVVCDTSADPEAAGTTLARLYLHLEEAVEWNGCSRRAARRDHRATTEPAEAAASKTPDFKPLMWPEDFNDD